MCSQQRHSQALQACFPILPCLDFPPLHSAPTTYKTCRPGKERAREKDGYTTLEQIQMVGWYHTHSGNNVLYKTWQPWKSVARAVLAQMRHVMGLLLCFVMMMRGDELRTLELCDCSIEWVVALDCWALKFSLDVNKTHNDVSVWSLVLSPPTGPSPQPLPNSYNFLYSTSAASDPLKQTCFW